MESSSAHGLPEGYPEYLSGPLTWDGKHWDAHPEEYIEPLTEDNNKELSAAVDGFLSLGLERTAVNRENFRIPEALAARLEKITDTIYRGRGFHVLRGLNLSLFTDVQRVILYAGLTSYVANRRAINVDHIRDMTHANPQGDELRPLEQSVGMGFHTDIDVGDILSMFVQAMPLEGGHNYIASINTAYNLLAKSDPEVLNTLFAKWHWEREYRPEPDQTVKVKMSRPLLAFTTPENKELQVNFAYTFIGGNPNYPLSPDAPPLTTAQKHALDTLSTVAEETCVHFVPQPGDFLFVNNYALMHARGSFVNSQTDKDKQRHMMRLWLHDDQEGWASAPGLQRRLDQYELFGQVPDKETLMTAKEWDQVPRGWRVRQAGISNTFCHD